MTLYFSPIYSYIGNALSEEKCDYTVNMSFSWKGKKKKKMGKRKEKKSPSQDGTYMFGENKECM